VLSSQQPIGATLWLLLLLLLLLLLACLFLYMFTSLVKSGCRLKSEFRALSHHLWRASGGVPNKFSAPDTSVYSMRGCHLFRFRCTCVTVVVMAHVVDRCVHEHPPHFPPLERHIETCPRPCSSVERRPQRHIHWPCQSVPRPVPHFPHAQCPRA